jgi:Kef-type K+ transport system membrane component KefB
MPDALEIPFDEPASFFVVIFLAILVGPILARWARLPSIVGLVVIGTAIGPGGLGLLQRDGSVALLGGAGLLYLMFVAGLDLDREGFHREQRAALVFSISTTVIPMAVTTGAGLLLGLEPLAALLIASAFTSHTLVTYPIVQRSGLGEARAATISLGGTLVSTVLALLVLAVVAAAHSGTLGPVFWAGFVGGIVAFFTTAFTGLPRLASWFFTGLGRTAPSGTRSPSPSRSARRSSPTSSASSRSWARSSPGWPSTATCPATRSCSRRSSTWAAASSCRCSSCRPACSSIRRSC